MIGMLVKRAMGERGQIVVPKDIRERFGLQAGTELTFDIKGDQIVMKPAKTPEQFVEEFCSISSRRIHIKDGPKWIKKVLDEQYEEEYGIR